jgi:hypothetical protein
MHNDVATIFTERISPTYLQPSNTVPGRHTPPSPVPSEYISTPELVSPPSTRRNSRASSPFAATLPPSAQASGAGGSALAGQKNTKAFQRNSGDDTDDDDWDDFGSSKGDDNEYDSEADDMPSDLRPSLDRYHDGKSQEPLLSSKDGGHPGYDSPPRPGLSRRSTSKFHERDPEVEAKRATRKRYTYAAFFLVLSLVSFAVQTETAVYIQSQLHWEKAYCML